MPPLTNITLEVACFSVNSVVQAARNGADRIEFCTDYEAGGLTPLSRDVREARRAVGLTPINVMIRRRPGTDFRVDSHEAENMKTDIIVLKPLASGFVFGVLDDEGNIDFDKNRHMVRIAYPWPCTFHRAFDHANGDLYEKLETVRRCGFTSILTSGYPNKGAMEGMDSLEKLVSMAKPMEITIIVGGGVRSSNLEELIHNTEATAYHTAAIVHGTDCDIQEIRQMREIINDQPD